MANPVREGSGKAEESTRNCHQNIDANTDCTRVYHSLSLL